MSMVRPAIGGVLALLLLSLWRLSYAYGCFSLLLPLSVLLLIGLSQFEYLYRRRICIISCIFRQESWFFALLTRKLFVGIYSAFFALVYTLSLSSFTAFAKTTDWLFLAADALIVIALYPSMQRRCDIHIVDGMAPIIAKRLVVITSFLIISLIYVIVSFYLIPSPAYIDPLSLPNTMDQASQSVASTCSAINITLKSFQEADAFAWFYMVIGTSKLGGGIFPYLAWLLFLFNSGLVFLAMSRLSVELTTIFNTHLQQPNVTHD